MKDGILTKLWPGMVPETSASQPSRPYIMELNCSHKCLTKAPPVKINDDHQSLPSALSTSPHTRIPSISERPQGQKAFSARGAKSEFGSATTLAIICRPSATAIFYRHGSLLCHSSMFLLSCFKASQQPGRCGPLVGNAVRKKTTYLTFEVCAGVQWLLSWVAAT
jgi:hypothetical protein